MGEVGEGEALADQGDNEQSDQAEYCEELGGDGVVRLAREVVADHAEEEDRELAGKPVIGEAGDEGGIEAGGGETGGGGGGGDRDRDWNVEYEQSAGAMKKSCTP